MCVPGAVAGTSALPRRVVQHATGRRGSREYGKIKKTIPQTGVKSQSAECAGDVCCNLYSEDSTSNEKHKQVPTIVSHRVTMPSHFPMSHAAILSRRHPLQIPPPQFRGSCQCVGSLFSYKSLSRYSVNKMCGPQHSEDLNGGLPSNFEATRASKFLVILTLSAVEIYVVIVLAPYL